MSGSPVREGAPRVADEEWGMALAVARELAEKVSGLSHRLAAVERQLGSADGQGPVRPRPSGQ
jgi:hypothetical protein